MSLKHRDIIQPRVGKRRGARFEILEVRSLLSTILPSPGGEDGSASDSADVATVAPPTRQVAVTASEASDRGDAAPTLTNSTTMPSASPSESAGEDAPASSGGEDGAISSPRVGSPSAPATPSATDDNAPASTQSASSPPMTSPLAQPPTAKSDASEIEDGKGSIPAPVQRTPAPSTGWSSTTSTVGSSLSAGGSAVLGPAGGSQGLAHDASAVDGTEESVAPGQPKNHDGMDVPGSASATAPRGNVNPSGTDDEGAARLLANSGMARSIAAFGTGFAIPALAITATGSRAPASQIDASFSAEMPAYPGAVQAFEETGLAVVQGVPFATRAADLLAGFSPFDRESLEEAVDHVLARLGALKGGLLNLDVTTSLIPNITAAAVVISVAELIRRRNRADHEDSADEEERPRGLPGLPFRWALEEA